MKNKKKGILFWLTGLSGSGKTSLAKELYSNINKNYGPTIVLSGDDLRSDFNLHGYDRNSRERIGIMYSNFFKRILDQKVNIIFAGIVLIENVRIYNRKIIPNYFEIYIKSNIHQVKKIKNTYKLKRNVVGLDIIPEFPTKPDIIINNNFKSSKKEIAKKVLNKILKKIPLSVQKFKKKI